MGGLATSGRRGATSAVTWDNKHVGGVAHVQNEAHNYSRLGCRQILADQGLAAADHYATEIDCEPSAPRQDAVAAAITSWHRAVGENSCQRPRS